MTRTFNFDLTPSFDEIHRQFNVVAEATIDATGQVASAKVTAAAEYMTTDPPKYPCPERPLDDLELIEFNHRHGDLVAAYCRYEAKAAIASEQYALFSGDDR